MNEIALTPSGPGKIRSVAADTTTDPTVHRTAEAADIAYHPRNQRNDKHLSLNIYDPVGYDMFIKRIHNAAFVDIKEDFRNNFL